MMPNPPCPHCGGVTRKNGTTLAGSQRYRCKDCKKSHTPNPQTQSCPRVKTYANPAARVKAWRERQKDQEIT